MEALRLGTARRSDRCRQLLDADAGLSGRPDLWKILSFPFLENAEQTRPPDARPWHDARGVLCGLARSELLDACRANRRAHFRDLGIDQFLQIFGRALITRGHVRDDFFKPLVHPRRVEGRRKRCIELSDDRLGRALWEEQAKPSADFEIRQALLGRTR